MNNKLELHFDAARMDGEQRPYKLGDIYDTFETVMIKKNLRSSITIVNKDILQFQSKLHVQKKIVMFTYILIIVFSNGIFMISKK